MTFKEFTGKNVEEAIRTAMKEFESDLSDLDIEILAQGSRGILGVGSEQARILAAPKSAMATRPAAEPAATAEPAPAPGAPEQEPTVEEAAQPEVEPAEAAAEEEHEAERPRTRGRRGGRGRGVRGGEAAGEERPARAERAPSEERAGREPAPFVPGKPLEELTENERAVVDAAQDVLTELLRLMNLPGTVELVTSGETARLNVRGDDLGVLIGRRGEKLASLQHVVNLIVARRVGQHNRIVVDVENYRGRREEQLRDVADRAAKRVAQTGKIIQLEAMPAMERRIVHLALSEHPKVRTQSVGVEPNRRIVILPASQVDRGGGR